jgi:DNA-binding beta-propeller fold protein YncE
MIHTRIVTAFLFLSTIQAAGIHTIAGNGVAGFSPTQINNPYGLTIGPDGALYFCEIGNHVVRRLDLRTHALSIAAGCGKKGYSGDGGPAKDALLNEPYEVRFDRAGNMFFVEMQNHVIRRVDAKTGIISTVAGTGAPGSGDNQFNQPHSIAFAPDGALLVCDIRNQRIRRIDLASGSITTLNDAPLAGPRAIDFDAAGNMYLALREGNAIDMLDRAAHQYVRLASIKGPKGLSYFPPGKALYVADTEAHRIQRLDPATKALAIVAGTGERGDGPDGDPLACKLARPHGVFAAPDGKLYIADSENHRIRVIQ